MMRDKDGRATSVQVILDGCLTRNGNTILDASSTVAMVVASRRKVIVDTGSAMELDRLQEALRAAGVNPDEVDFVVNTHLHLDHIGGNGLFRNARFYAHNLEFPPLGTVRVTDGFMLLPGVELLPTPGHTAGSISVLVNADRRYAICGDAIPTKANLDSMVPPLININPWLALKSMETIGASADVIIPGHGPLFEVTRRR